MSEQELTPEQKVFHSYRCFETSAEVWAVLHARHGKHLRVFSTFSDPTGTQFDGDGTIGRMETTYGFDGGDHPVIGCRTTWSIERCESSRNVKYEYFIMIVEKERE